MVSAKVADELRRKYESNERVIDLDKYAGALFDVAFDVVTADTLIAGIASKILDERGLTIKERAVVSEPFLVNGRWRLGDGQLVDLRPHSELKRIAGEVEALRAKCYQAVTQSDRT